MQNNENNEPGPAIMKTPEFMNIKKEFVIFLSNDNKAEYNLSIELNNELIILLLKNKDDISFKCQKEYSLEEMHELSKIFVFYPNLSDIYNYLVEMIENKNLVLKKNLDEIYLTFTFENPRTRKNEEVKLFLEKKLLNKEEENNLIIKEINELKKEVKELKEENKYLKQELEKKKENNNDIIKDNLEQIINVLIEEKIKEKEKEKEKNNNNDKNKENELKNINEFITILNNDHNEQIKKLQDKVNEMNSKINNLTNNDFNSLKTSLKEEVQNVNNFINNINNITQEDILKVNNNIREIEKNLFSSKSSLEEEIKSLQLIINSTEEEIQSIKYLVNDLGTNSGLPQDNRREKENTILNLITIIKQKITDYQNTNIQLKLLYDAGRDGRNCNDCHTKCNNVPNTLTLITTTKGIKFGFFRSIPINGNGEWKQDNKAFFISLDKKKIYKIQKDKSAVKFDDNYFMNTLNFSLSGNILSDKYTCTDKTNMNLNFEGFTEEFELTCGDKNFYIKKFQVYQLEFNC